MKLINKLKSILEYIFLMGFNWFIFRVKYELLKRFNYFDKVNRSILNKVNSSDKKLFTYNKVDLINKDFKGDSSFVKKADEAIQGNIFSFSNEYLNYNENRKLNWHMNPMSKVKADNNLSWNSLPDFGEYGDIKLIWEASRFPQVYYFINAYAKTKDEKYANACIHQILDWIDNNTYPKGVNYKCGQEISFRVFAWVNTLEYFNDFFSKEDKKKIVQNIYISLLRIDANIDYAAKSVRNNHSISEASGLFIGGLLFPQFEESKKFVKKGLKYLLHETNYQVYDDGSYIQHSFTYQRLVLDVLSFVFLISEKKKFHLPELLEQRHKKLYIFLNAFMQKNGWLPNYGSNDGANLFPIENNDYRDFRPSLSFARGESDFFNKKFNSSYKSDNKIQFDSGGYYILTNKEIFSFIRCHSYKDRPASSDMFHTDIWHKGKNIFCDTGSYSYNTDKEFKNNFVGTVGHNSVMINDTNQMQQVLNFGYTNWTQADCLTFSKDNFVGKNYAYKKIFGVVHDREIALNNNILIITDTIKNITSSCNVKQIWNTKYDVKIIDETTLEVENCIITSNLPFIIEDAYISDYYNSYSVGKKIIFEVNTDKDVEIKTTMEFS